MTRLWTYPVTFAVGVIVGGLWALDVLVRRGTHWRWTR